MLTTRYSSAAAALVALLLTAAPAVAQDRLLVGGRELGAIRNFGQVLGPGPAVVGDDIFGGGRYVVRRLDPLPDGTSAISVVDGRTGIRTAIRGGFIAVDRARPAVFVARATTSRRVDSVWVVNVVTGEERQLVTAPILLYEECAHAYSANVLFCASLRSDARIDDPRADVLAVDVATGNSRVVAVVPLLALLGGGFWSPLATPDGRRVYFSYLASITLDPFQATADYAMLDTASGAVTRHPLPDDRPMWDDARERLIVATDTPDFRAGLVSIYTKDLVPLVYRVPLPVVPVIHTSPHTGRMYVAAITGPGPRNGPWRERLWVLDSGTFDLLAPPVDRIRNDVPSAVVGPGAVAVLTAPGPPRGVVATVSGRSVDLSWTNVGGASGFVLEAGVAPGRADVTAYVGPDPRASFTNVPPGAYYVRVRGGNEFGGGRPSAEVRIDVP